MRGARAKGAAWRRGLPLLLAGVSAFALSCGAPVSAGQAYTIKIGSLVTPWSVWGKVVAQVQKEAQKRTGGRVKIEHLHSGMLGGEKSMLEMVMLGGIHAAGLPSSSLAALAPEVNVLELPFLFDDYDEAYYLIDNVIAPHLRRKLLEKGLVSSAFMENGFMEFVAPRFIRSPVDLRGLKIGSWESPLHIAFWKALGAKPIPLPTTEVLNAHARGIVDSGANSINALIAWDNLFGSALKRDRLYVTEVRYSYQAGVLVANAGTWKALPEELRKTVDELLSEMTPVLRRRLRLAEPESRRELIARGYNVTSMSEGDRKAFIEKTARVYGEFEKKVGKEFLETVLAEREKYRARMKEKDGKQD
ncbi:MAG: TRAP transporter substrate-binding protein [bacterium]